MSNNIIVDKSFDFAVKIVNLYQTLVIEKREYILSKQIVRSGTSIGANVKEGIKGYSKADFKYKMSIALKEANETEFWLELLLKTKIIEDNQYSKTMISECKEICRILEKIVRNS